MSKDTYFRPRTPFKELPFLMGLALLGNLLIAVTVSYPLGKSKVRAIDQKVFESSQKDCELIQTLIASHLEFRALTEEIHLKSPLPSSFKNSLIENLKPNCVFDSKPFNFEVSRGIFTCPNHFADLNH